MSVLGLSYENTDEEGEEVAVGSLVAYEPTEEHSGEEAAAQVLEDEEDEEGGPSPKRPRIEKEEEADGRERTPPPRYEEDERREEEEQESAAAAAAAAGIVVAAGGVVAPADFEDQSFYPPLDGRSLMEAMLPPRSEHAPDATLQRKIVEFHRLRRQGRAKSINEKIRHARNFKNPYMLNWLVSHCGIDETGSNYPKDLFDPAAIRREAAEVMEEHKKQKQLAAAAQQGRTAIDFTPGEGITASAAPGILPLPTVPPVGVGVAPRPIVKVVEGTKRSSKTAKSKWDQGDPTKAVSGPAQPAGTASRYAEYALQKKAEVEARLRNK